MLSSILLFFFCSFVLFITYRWYLHRRFHNIRLEQDKTYETRKRCNIEHTTTTINNTASEIWRISSKSTNSNNQGSRLIYIMIPGNPGISSAYVHWMRIVVSLFVQQQNKNKTYSAMDVYIVSHANHFNDPHNYNQHKLFTLNDQINHKIDCIKYITERHKYDKQCEYVFAGHSIGAFICLKVLKHFSYIDIKQIHLWAPTIVNIGKSRNGLRAQRLNHHFGFLLPLIQFIACYILPFWLIKLLFVSPSICNTDYITRTLQCKNARILMNFAFMGETEMNEVIGLDRTEMDRLLKHHRKEIVFYWAENDGWAHKQCWIDIKDLFKKQYDHEMNEIFAYWEIDHDLKHAIMIDDLEKNVEIKLANKILDWIHHY